MSLIREFPLSLKRINQSGPALSKKFFLKANTDQNMESATQQIYEALFE